jgi:hypothetical protein
MFISDTLVFNATDLFDSATGKWSTAELTVARNGMSAVSSEDSPFSRGVPGWYPGCNVGRCKSMLRSLVEAIELIVASCYML